MAVGLPGIENNLNGTLTDQTSGTPYGNFRNDFPTAGVDQPSDTFRINYKVIQEAVENLQSRTITITGAATSAPVTIGSGSGNINISTSLVGSYLPITGGTMTGPIVLGTGASIVSDSGLDLVLTPDSGFNIVLDGLSWPNVDGSTGEALITDGAGNLSWGTFLDEVVSDTTPELGGDLDTNGFALVGAPHIDLTTTAPDARVRISGSGPGPADGIVSAQDAPAASNNPGGILTLRGGDGDGLGFGGNVVLAPGVPGGTALPGSAGNIQIGYRDPGAGSDTAIWPDADGAATEVLTTDGAGNLYWSAGGGGGGSGTVTSVATGPGLTGGPITTSGTVAVDIFNLAENVAPTGNHWVMVESPGGGTLEKAQIQNLPGGGIAGTGDVKRALVIVGALQSVPDTTPTTVTWPVVSQQVGSWWSGGAPSRLTVPSGVSIVKVSAGIRLSAPTIANGVISIKIKKNGSTVFVGNPSLTSSPATTGEEYTFSVVSPVLNVVPGNYFEVEVFQNTGTALDIPVSAANTYFGIEEVGVSAQELDDLNDVTLTTPSTNEVLIYNGSQWVNGVAPLGAGGTNTQIQYNNAGLLAGDTGMTTDGNGNIVIVGGLDVDNINVDGTTISTTGPGTNEDLTLAPAGTGAVIANALVEVDQLRFADHNADTFNWLVEENSSGHLTFDYNAVERLRVESTGLINITGTVTTNAATDMELIPGAGGLVTTYSGYDMSSGPDEVLATKGYVNTVSGVTTLSALTDVALTTPTTLDMLQYNGSQWINVAVTPGHGTSNSIDDHSDVDTSTTSPNSGAFLTWDGSSEWVTNNAVIYNTTGSEALRITNTTNPNLVASFEVNDSLDIAQVTALVSDPTERAQLFLSRDDGVDSNPDNIAFTIETAITSREINLRISDPNTGFSDIKTIAIDADNGIIDFDTMYLKNITKVSATGGATNQDLELKSNGTGLVVAQSGYDMSSGPDYAFATKDYVDGTTTAPGGSDTQIQYNNSGALGGDAGFTTNGAGSVEVTGDLTVGNVNVTGNTVSTTDTDGNLLLVPDGDGVVSVGGYKISKRVEIALASTQTNTAIFSYTGSQFEAMWIDYTFTVNSGASREMGTFMILNNGTTVNSTNSPLQVGPTGDVVLSAAIAAGTVTWRYTSTLNGAGFLAYSYRTMDLS